ncbi:MAG: TolC family protein [Gemmatimonadota bacterium]|nr:TolC family protein [Gemmatimonadota bacterium]
MKPILLLVVLVTPSILLGQENDALQEMTLDQAVARAVEAAPIVSTAEGAVFAAQGRRAQVTWPFAANPTVEFERTRRRSPGGEVYDVGWRFGQSFEISGSSLRSREAAETRVMASEAYVGDAIRRASLEARVVYAALHLSEQRAALSATNAELAAELATLARRQLDAGEINVLAYNTAALEAARALSLADRLEGERRAAQAELARVLAVGGDRVIRTTALPTLPAEIPGIDVLMASAVRRRPDLNAVTLEVDAATENLTANRRRRFPTLELAVFEGEEDGTDDLLGLSLGVSLPLFQRNQGDVGAARAEQAAAEARSAATIRAIRSQVDGWAERYKGASSAERRFADELLLASLDNVELAGRAFQEGELSVADVVVFRSTALATQLEYLEVLAEAYEAWFQQAAAVDPRPDELPDLAGAPS